MPAETNNQRNSRHAIALSARRAALGPGELAAGGPAPAPAPAPPAAATSSARAAPIARTAPDALAPLVGALASERDKAAGDVSDTAAALAKARAAFQAAERADAEAREREERIASELAKAEARRQLVGREADEARYADLLHAISSKGVREVIDPQAQQVLVLLDVLAAIASEMNAAIAGLSDKRRELLELARKLGHIRRRGDGNDDKPGHCFDLDKVHFLDMNALAMTELSRMVRDHCKARGIEHGLARFLRSTTSDDELRFASAIRE
jgi:hypothetical protein